VATAERLAAVLAEAHRAGVLLEPGQVLGGLDLVRAYAVQDAGLAVRLARGERLVGWKIGYTSAAMRTGNPLASNAWMKSIPLSPASAARHVDGASSPRGVTAPIPVTATRFTRQHYPAF